MSKVDNTINVYMIYRPKNKDYKFSIPFFALEDNLALDALVETAKTMPEIVNSYVYKIGVYDLNKGIIEPCEKVLIQNKKENSDEEIQN